MAKISDITAGKVTKKDPDKVPGMIEPGNIDMNTRPRVTNPDGSISSVRSIGVNFDGFEYVIPTVTDDGRVVSNEEAIELFKTTGKHLGNFKDVESSNAFAIKLHESEAKKLQPRGSVKISDLLKAKLTPDEVSVDAKPDYNPKGSEANYTPSARAGTVVSGQVMIGKDGKLITIHDDLAEELAYSDPSYFEAVKTRVGELGNKVLKNPVKSTLWNAPLDFASQQPGYGEFLLSGVTDLSGSLVGIGKTVLETPGMILTGGSSFNVLGLNLAAEVQRELNQPELDVEHQEEGFFRKLGNRLVHNIDGMREAMRYQPRTETGEALVGLMGMGFGEIATQGSAAADMVFERTGSPMLATAVRIIPEAVMMLGPLGLRGKADKVMPVIEENAGQRAAGIKTSIFDQALKKEFDTLTPDEIKTQAKLREDIKVAEAQTNRSPEAENAIKSMKAELEQLDRKEMAVEQNTIKTAMNPQEVLSFVTDEQLATTSPDGITQFLFGEGTVGAVKATEPVELVMGADGMKVKKGLEAAAAAALFGESKIPVRILVETMDTATMDKLATHRSKVVEATKARKAALEKAQQQTLSEKAATWIFDRKNVGKSRLMKEFGKDAVPAIQLVEQLRHSSTSGGLFAKIVDRQIFSKLKDEPAIIRDLGGGKKQTITEIDVFNQIVNNRVALQIAERRPTQKFPGNMRAVHYRADMLKLQKELGPKKFLEYMTLADELIGPRGFYKELLKRKFLAGLIDKKSCTKLSKYDYEPTRYLDELDPLMAYDTLEGRKITQRGSGIEALSGGKTSMVELDARTLFVDLALRTHKQIATNNAVKALATLADKKPNNKLVRRVTKANPKPSGTLSIEYMENGVKREIAVDPTFGEMWKYSTPDMIEQASKVMQWASGAAVVKQAAVGLNPLFFLRDIPRNITMVSLAGARMLSGKALYSSDWDYVPGVGAFMRPAMTAYDMFSVLPDAVARKGLFNELAEANAFPTFLADVAIQELRPFYKQHPKLQKISNALSWTNQTSEIIMRMGVAQRALRRQQERGEPRNIQEAAYEASRIIDYGQSGYISGALDKFIPFFNPAVQGMRGGIRGIVEDPGRSTAFLTNVMGMAATLYLYNYLRAPETMSQIPDDHLSTGVVIPLADWMRTQDADGNVVYPYIHIPIDNAMMPFVGSSNWFMRYAITGEIPHTPIRDMFTNIIPGGGVPTIPMLDAVTKLFSNYDAWRDAQVYPNNEAISRFNEFYPIGHRKETPRMYVWAGEQMNALGLGNVDLASPERLRAAVDTFVGSSPFSHLWSANFDPLLEDPASYKSQLPYDIMLAQQPGIRSIYKITHPSTNAFRESETMLKPYGDLQKRYNDLAQTLLRQTIAGQVTRQQAMKNLWGDENVPGDIKQSALKRYTTGVIYHRISSAMPADSRVGLPGLSWWQNSAENLNPRDRAILFFSEWKKKQGSKRDAMWNMARRLSVEGLGFAYIDGDGKFMTEFNRLKKVYGEEAEPSFIDLKVDLVTPSLKDLR